MKRIIIAFVASTIVATPAVAQWHGRDRGSAWTGADFWRGAPESPWARIDFMQKRIDRGVANGSLDRREAYRANHELNGVRDWLRRKHWQEGQLTPDQRARVQARLDQISRDIHWMRHDA